jgi:hypothetical protein
MIRVRLVTAAVEITEVVYRAGTWMVLPATGIGQDRQRMVSRPDGLQSCFHESTGPILREN